MNRLRPIAIYLPQFHPIPENDAWWGKGFTEWTNVTKARPLFEGHYQPHLPADLGFYDLRLPEARAAQAALAKQYGIYGFCYYHYWFNGRRILERPFEEVLASGKPDFPFMLCWANENWTRRWDGLEQEVLLKQEYSPVDDQVHVRDLCRAFADPRYIRVAGKPVFVVYRPALFPDIRKTADCWREEARRQGIGELYLVYVQGFGNNTDPAEIGFDAALEFQPDFGNLPARQVGTFRDRLLNRLKITPSAYPRNRIFGYDAFIARMMAKPRPAFTCYPGVTPGWDNSPRRTTDAHILTGSTPDLYGKWLQHTVNRFRPPSSDENFLFINAWNEWAEGNHLEPCQKWGRSYLETTRNALTNA
ncbi:MAG: glycoside hydrolase family 99-like domain-containing protein [Ferruginibacter sp.]|nr:glycoside hydrolase family 99-like domain-containing protein [Cytophagales bacterium]